MLLPLGVPPYAVRHRPRITHLLYDNTLAKNMTRLPSRPCRSELRRLLARVDQIDLAGPDHLIHDLQLRLLRLIIPGPF